MKTKITLAFFGLFSTVLFAQNFDLFRSKTQTQILYDRVVGLSDATHPKLDAVTDTYFRQVYHEMQRADFLNRLPNYEFLKKETQLAQAKKQVPLSILVTEFESIKKTAIDANDVYINANNQYEVKPNVTPFENHQLAIMAPLVGKSSEATIEFILKNQLVFNTTQLTIASIAANFNDGLGWRGITIDQPVRIRYQSAGIHPIDFKITFANGTSSSSHSQLETTYDLATNRNPQNALASTIFATIPYQGYDETQALLGQGEYQIFLDNTNGVLDKPIFLIDGFDPGNARDIPTIYSLLNYGTGQNLADNLRNQGFDIIILNFPTYTSATTVVDGGGDYIQRNAMTLVALINQINSQKVGTQKNVVIGPSEGGLTARYALRYMEMHSMNPDTRLFLSFDAPHLGANFPIGMQHLFNYMGYGPLNDTTIQGLVDTDLKSAASKEMLIDHFEGHLQSGSAYEFDTTNLLPTGCPNFRTAFQTELTTMGFPTTTRNIAIANGSSNGTTTGTPNMIVMDHTFNTTATTRAIITLHFTPAANQQNEVSHFKGQGLLFGTWFTAYESLANSKAPTYTDGLDSAPGGTVNIASVAGGTTTNPTLTEFIANLQIQEFDFIPSNSALAVSNSTNLYTPIGTATQTPFAAYSISTANENHVTLNAQNVAFALNEILNPALATTTNQAFAQVAVLNPIGNNIDIIAPNTINDAAISVTDVTGKVVFVRDHQSIEGNYQIPLALTNGMYLLTIRNSDGEITKKLIKN